MPHGVTLCRTGTAAPARTIAGPVIVARVEPQSGHLEEYMALAGINGDPFALSATSVTAEGTRHRRFINGTSRMQHIRGRARAIIRIVFKVGMPAAATIRFRADAVARRNRSHHLRWCIRRRHCTATDDHRRLARRIGVLPAIAGAGAALAEQHTQQGQRKIQEKSCHRRHRITHW